MLFEAFIIPSLMKRYDHLTRAIIKTAHCCLSFPAPLLNTDLGLFAFFAPFVAYRGRIGQRKFIFKQQDGINWAFLKPKPKLFFIQ